MFLSFRSGIKDVEISVFVQMKGDRFLSNPKNLLIVGHFLLEFNLIPALEQFFLHFRDSLCSSFVIQFSDPLLIYLLFINIAELHPLFKLYNSFLRKVEHLHFVIIFGFHFFFYVLIVLFFEYIVKNIHEMVAEFGVCLIF